MVQVQNFFDPRYSPDSPFFLSFVALTMGKKVFKPAVSDIDAGTHHERLYDKALHPWRAKLRRSLIPLVRAETPHLATMQVSVNEPTSTTTTTIDIIHSDPDS